MTGRLAPGRQSLLRRAGGGLAFAFRVLPRAWRYDAARHVARALQPAIARTDACRRRRAANTDGVAEISLDLVMIMLTRHGVAFDPRLRIENEALLQPGSLVLAAHCMLNSLLLRHWHDRAHPAFGVAADADFDTPGVGPAIPVLPSGPHLLQRIRRALEGGHSVLAMIDRGEDERRTTRFDTPVGALRVSDALPRLGLRMAVPIVFMATRLERGEAVCRLARAAPGAALADVLEQFASFVAGACATALAADVAREARPPPAADLARGRSGDAPG